MPQDFRELNAMLAKARGEREPGVAVPNQKAAPGSQRHCPGCGYDMSGLPVGGRCPECGLVQMVKRGSGTDDQSGRRPKWVGACIAIGWMMVAGGWLIAWVGFVIEQTMFAVPREVMGIVGGVIVAMGGVLATVGSAAVLWMDADKEVREKYAAWVRVVAIAAPLAWGAAGVCCAIGLVLELQGWDTPLWALGVIFLAGLLSAVYGRVMSTVCESVEEDIAQRRLEMSVIGMPIGVTVFCLGAVWASAANWVAFGTYLLMCFVTLLGGALVWGFVMGTRGAGMGLWWAKRNVEGAAARDRRRIERWQKRAEKDKEKERRFGNSVGH